MIISHKHKFIFIKTNKTAGTSIEIALSKFCGPDDIITPLPAADAEIRKQLGYPGPQNHNNENLRFRNHISAKAVKDNVGDEVWNNYFKFCFERNPWDRVLSLYWWRNANKPESRRPTISAFISSEAPVVLKKRGQGLYTIDDKIVVDRVCKYENLVEELETIRNQIGLPEPLELPKSKSGFKKDKRSYRELLTDEDQDRIAKLFKEEIELMGYQW